VGMSKVPTTTFAEESSVVEVECQDREQHDDGAGEGVQEEFDGGVEAALASPDADEEIHGNEHDFPENIEEKEIKGEKTPSIPVWSRRSKM